MQIWKFLYMFVFKQKQYPENFALKFSLICDIFYCFCMSVNKYVTYLTSANLKNKNALSSETFGILIYEKINIAVDFDICIGVPLNYLISAAKNFILCI